MDAAKKRAILKSKHIVIYFEQYSWGGTDTHLESLLIGWPNRSDQFTILCNTENVGIERIRKSLESLGNVKIKKFRSLSRVGSILKFPTPKLRKLGSLVSFPFFWFFWFLQFVQAFGLIKEEENVEALIANNGGYPGGWGCNFAIVASRFARIPRRVLLIHHQATDFRKSLKAIEVFFDDVFFNSSTDVVAVSEATKKTIVERRNFPSQLELQVIYNGININENFNPKCDDLRAKFESGGRKLVGIMGVVERYKGHEDLIKALNRMEPDLLKSFQFLIIGKGDKGEIDYLQSLIATEKVSEAICFTGYVEGESQAIIQQLDLMLVLTKDFEGFGLTLAEAMSVKVPVMATRVGAIPEFIFHLENGYIIEPSCEENILLGLEDFSNNPNVWEIRADKAFNSIKEFSQERLGQEFFELIGSE